MKDIFVKTIRTPRVLLSFATIVAAIAVLLGASYAFLSDTETSQANSLTAGVLDLKIDNSSYYNGEVSTETTWELDDLDGKLFFDFNDLKPGDWGEDTISIHVIDNVSLGLTPVRTGASTPGWWENMPRFVETFNFTLTDGSHTLRIEHLAGDSSLCVGFCEA